MKSMMKFFKTQMKSTVCLKAKERVSLEIMPKLCIDHDICPACGGNLKLEKDMNRAYVWSLKICVECGEKFEIDAAKRRQYGR